MDTEEIYLPQGTILQNRYELMSVIDLHGMGIIHRDLSPGNLMLSEDGVLYLIDFGSATSYDGKEELWSGQVFEHKGFEAPESSQPDRQGRWTDNFPNEWEVFYHAKTDIGTRQINQDNFMVDTVFCYKGEDCEQTGTLTCRPEEIHVAAFMAGEPLLCREYRGQPDFSPAERKVKAHQHAPDEGGPEYDDTAAAAKRGLEYPDRIFGKKRGVREPDGSFPIRKTAAGRHIFSLLGWCFQEN